MEVIPFLEPGDKAAVGLWYLVSPDGELPCERVGHACLAIAENHGVDQSKDEREELQFANKTIILIGGATPSGPFGDVYFLKLSNDGFLWSKIETEGLIPRYEHGVIADGNSNIFVFGGAQQTCNLNSTQILRNGERKWNICEAKGCVPCPRTCLNVAALNGKMYVFGGGLQGPQPVSDTLMHIFNTADCSWTQTDSSGNPPTPRHGHVMVSNDNKIYIHGGMAGGHIYDDLYSYDTDANKWELIKQVGDVPAARTAHAGVNISNLIYIFGGMNLTGALNDLHKLDATNLIWSKVCIKGPAPPPRLDHTMICVDIPTKESRDDGEPIWNKQLILLVFGGMDTRGEIFNDLLAIAVE